MEGQNYAEGVLSVPSILLPAVLIAVCNLGFQQQIKDLFEDDVEQREAWKRFRYEVFFTVNIFTYLYIEMLLWWRSFCPILPVFLIAYLVSVYLTKCFFAETNTDFSEFLKTLGLDKDRKMSIVEGWTIKHLMETTEEPPDIFNSFLVRASALDPRAPLELSILLSNRSKEKSSSRDILFALYTCCDPILLQELIRKLSTNGNAVPFLLPNCDTKEVTLLLWGLRKTSLPLLDTRTQSIEYINVTNFPILTICAIRLGDISISKSDVLNKLLALSYGSEKINGFLSYSQDPPRSVWSQGSVECQWFLQKGEKEKNVINVPFVLLNLRGNGRLCKKQVQLCCKISSIGLIFADSVAEDELQSIRESMKHVILLNCSSKTCSIRPTSRLTIINSRNSDLTHVSKNIIKIISAMGSSVVEKVTTVESITQICDDLGIKVDEKMSEHQIAKSNASRTIDELTSGGTNEENNDTSLNFLRSTNLSIERKTLYFAWLQMLLHYKNASVLATALGKFILTTKRRQEAYNKINRNKSLTSTECDISEDIENEVQVQTQAMIDCIETCDKLTLRFHRFVRKLWDGELRRQTLPDTAVDALPKMFANSLLKGIPLEIVNLGENYQSSIEFLREVVEGLNNFFQTRKLVRVISVLGGTSSYKSTLLNALFGTNFQVGGGRCSQNVIMQLVPVCNSMRQKLGCDFLLVVDTQGLSVAGSKCFHIFDQNNQTVTTCCSVSDVIIINTDSTIPQQDTINILEIVTSGLITIKERTRLPKCYFVQHIGDQTVRALDRDQRIVTFFEQLKLIVQRMAALEEHDQIRQEVLNAFGLDYKKNMTFIPRVNVGHEVKSREDYCANILNLRHCLLQIVGKLDNPALTFTDIYQRLVLVTQNHFQTTNTESLKSGLTERYRKRLLAVQQQLMEKLTVACNEVKNSEYELMNQKVAEAKENITSTTNKQYKELELRVEGIFQTGMYRSLKDQLRYFEKDMMNSKKSFVQEMERHLQKSIETSKQFQERDVSVRNECNQFVQIVHTLTENTETPRDEIKETFQSAFHCQVAKLKKKYPPRRRSEVDMDITTTMEKKLGKCSQQVKTLMGVKPMSEFSMKVQQGNTKKDIYVSKNKFNVVEDNHEKMLHDMRSKLKFLCDEHTQFKRNSHRMVNIIIEFQEKSHSAVENITVYLFLSSKFLCGVHICQLKEHADPVPSRSLENKTEHFITCWQNKIPDVTFEILKRVMTVKNVQNCDRLPFTFLTLQRLDRCFIDMIPELSSEDITNINSVVNDAKLIVFSKALTKARLDLGDTFEQIRSTIESSILLEGDTEEVQAAALVHLSAWCVGALSIKSYEDQNERNAANAFEKLEGLFEATLKSSLNENCTEEVANIVSREIHNTLIDAIQSDIVNHLRARFLSHNLFNVKKAFIGTILRDMCIQDNYNGFVEFLRNYDKFSQKWILQFLAEECNKENDSLLHKIALEVITAKLNAVVSALVETLSDFQKVEDQTFSVWLAILQHKLVINSNALSQGSIKITDFHTFTDKLINNVKSFDFQGSLFLPKVGNVDDTKTWLLSEGGDLHNELSKLIKGCIHQCPFCGAACEDTLEEHDAHKTALHYPIGVNGWRFIVTKKLCTGICTSNVASNNRYLTKYQTYRPYKDYKEDYPDWDIPPEDDQPMKFWKYVFAKFNQTFAVLHNCLKADIPDEWTSFSKEDAIQSVELSYNITPL